MGASFCEMALPRELSTARVRQMFAEVQDQDRYHNGHSYSGGFGMADGLQITQRAFPTREDARDWLEANCQKWEDAIAVTAADKDKRVWVIGAWCSS